MSANPLSEMHSGVSTAGENFSEGAAFVDGEYVPIGDAKISILDFGFTRSDVTYDVVHVWKGSFFRLDDHLSRFEKLLPVAAS